MILKTMSSVEIMREFEKDRDELHKRICGKFMHQYRKQVLRNGRYPYTFIHKAKFANGNYYVSHCIVPSKKMASRGCVLVTPALVLQTDQGVEMLNFSSVDTAPNRMVVEYSTHFLKRYRERMNLGTKMSVEDVIIHYLSRNYLNGRDIHKVRNGEDVIQFAVNDGSVYILIAEDRLIARTFIDKYSMTLNKSLDHFVSSSDMLTLEEMEEGLHEMHKQRKNERRYVG